MVQQTETLWTLNELGQRVEEALATDYPGPLNGRVRAVPDPRTIRYYTTLGLIDRPTAMRGRTALYGSRHLQQLVTIKRLQARGLSLAEVQQAIAGLPEKELTRLARFPEPGTPSVLRAAERVAFWRTEVPKEVDTSLAEVPPLAPEPEVALYTGLTLAPGVTLLISSTRPLVAADIHALQRAATPLMSELRARGLLSPAPSRERK